MYGREVCLFVCFVPKSKQHLETFDKSPNDSSYEDSYENKYDVVFFTQFASLCDPEKDSKLLILHSSASYYIKWNIIFYFNQNLNVDSVHYFFSVKFYSIIFRTAEDFPGSV